MLARTERRDLWVLGVAIAMTVLAEALYFAVWGIVLFPGGPIAAKAVWTAVCGVAIGAVIGAGVLFVVEGRMSGTFAPLTAAAIFALVGSGCAYLCARIDTQFKYFGGLEAPVLFVLAGVGPSIAGGLVYGWSTFGSATARPS